MATGHTWSSSSIANDDGFLVVVKIMDKIFKPVHVEGNVWNVEIETGVTVKDLDDYLRKHNPPLAMACNVDVECIRYGGIISMGSHGATTRTRSLKDLVDTIKIIDASGIMATFSKENDPVEFSAAALNLGLFGIIYARCVSRPCQVADGNPVFISFPNGPSLHMQLSLFFVTIL